MGRRRDNAAESVKKGPESHSCSPVVSATPNSEFMKVDPRFTCFPLGSKPDSQPKDPIPPNREIRIFPPWDILRGRDVFRDSDELKEEDQESTLGHYAPNCATFSRAREIPVKGVKTAPVPIRSLEHPTGIPREVEKMTRKQRKRLDNDTSMADLSAEACWGRAERGKGFSLEHPYGSIAWELPSWRRLKGRSDVFWVPYHTCMFEGSQRKKKQALLTNVESLARAMAKLCEGTVLCDRTHLKHLKWRPITSGGRVLQFVTGEEREYPSGFCRCYALALLEYLKPGDSFLEVFSGPNAPLSAAVGSVFKTPVPGGPLDTKGKGVKSELQALVEVMGEGKKRTRKGDSEEHMVSPRNLGLAEAAVNRLRTLESGKQPSFGKRFQIISDGINDPERHLEEALKLDHPFNTSVSLKQDHRKVLDELRVSHLQDVKRRLTVLQTWERLAKSEEVLKRQDEHDLRASHTARRLGLKPRTGLMEKLQEIYQIEDRAVPLLCRTGMPIIGDALESPFFKPYSVPATIAIRDLLATAPQRRKDLLRRVSSMSRAGGKAMAEAIWKKTMKEVNEGSMRGPLTETQVEELHGKHYNVVPAFGLRQGVDDMNQPKFRRIDDHSACLNNMAAGRKQRIEMAMVDYLVVLVKELSKAFPEPVHIGTEDMKGAYRQIPLPDTQVPIAITAVCDPCTAEPKLFELFAQPFGAAHAVPNFYRVSEWLARLVVRSMGILLDHFFDDYYFVCRSKESESCSFALREAFRILGFALDDQKSQVPCEIAQVLGVVINTRSLQEQRKLIIEPKPTRRSNLVIIIDKVLQDNFLAPSLAASIVGKFGFLCSTLYGKVGRCCTAALRVRQYSTSSDCSLNPQLRVSLQLMKLFTIHSTPREYIVNRTDPPLLLYTDASDLPEQGSKRATLGAVLIDQTRSLELHYTYWVVPETTLQMWASRQTYMGQLEILAGPLALATWPSILADRQVIHFVDNNAAASGLVKGYSPTQDSSPLVGEYWLRASSARADIYIERVESKSNLSDGPSRLNFHLMKRLHARFHPPCTETLMTSLYQFLHFFSKEQSATVGSPVAVSQPVGLQHTKG